MDSTLFSYEISVTVKDQSGQSVVYTQKVVSPDLTLDETNDMTKELTAYLTGWTKIPKKSKGKKA